MSAYDLGPPDEYTEDLAVVATLTAAPPAPSTDEGMRACPLSEWEGGPARCRWCNDRNPTTSHRWCGPWCVAEYKQNHSWKDAKQAAMLRDRRRCADCATDKVDRPGLLEVHHLVPVDGVRTASCLHHLDGLVTLCQTHHQRRHHHPAEASA